MLIKVFQHQTNFIAILKPIVSIYNIKSGRKVDPLPLHYFRYVLWRIVATQTAFCKLQFLQITATLFTVKESLCPLIDAASENRKETLYSENMSS